jgi:carbonic anhydrase
MECASMRHAPPHRRRVPLRTVVLGIAIIAASSTALARAQHWGYEGADGPEHWGSLDPSFAACDQGAEQSPIDLSPTVLRDDRNVALRNLPPIDFRYDAVPFVAHNNGHTVEVRPDGGGAIRIGGRRFDLQQLHFHAPAEHTLEGGAEFPIEMHLVHRAASGHLAVIGVLIRRGAANETLQPVWDDLPAQAGEEVAPAALLELPDLLPADRRSYRYDGSLTTPPCTEGVLWHVLREPIEMSNEQIDAFTDVLAASCCRRNHRPVQDLGGRRVVLDSGRP